MAVIDGDEVDLAGAAGLQLGDDLLVGVDVGGGKRDVVVGEEGAGLQRLVIALPADPVCRRVAASVCRAGNSRAPASVATEAPSGNGAGRWPAVRARSSLCRMRMFLLLSFEMGRVVSLAWIRNQRYSGATLKRTFARRVRGIEEGVAAAARDEGGIARRQLPPIRPSPSGRWILARPSRQYSTLSPGWLTSSLSWPG